MVIKPGVSLHKRCDYKRFLLYIALFGHHIIINAQTAVIRKIHSGSRVGININCTIAVHIQQNIAVVERQCFDGEEFIRVL